MASTNFTNFTRNLATGGHVFGTDTHKILLCASAPSESNLDSWVNRSDVTGVEVAAGSGYSTGGIAVTLTLDAIDTTNNRQSITPTNITNGWTSSTFSAVGAIIYKNSGSSATDKLITYVDFGGTVSCSSGTFSITFSTPIYITR